MNLIDQFPDSRPFVLEGSQEAILMFHGFTSAPHVFRNLAKELSKQFSYEIHVPLLPGHGLTPKQLTETSWREWIDFSEKQFLQLSSRYKRVHVMGLSMGGTLAAHLADRFPDIVTSITLFAPAIYIYGFWSRLALPMVRWFPKKILQEKYLTKQPGRFNDKSSYQNYTYASVVEFDSLCRFVKKEFNANVPLRVFVPTKDDVIDPESSQWLFEHDSHANKELIELTRSPHIVFMGEENDKINAKIVEFLKTLP